MQLHPWFDTSMVVPEGQLSGCQDAAFDTKQAPEVDGGGVGVGLGVGGGVGGGGAVTGITFTVVLEIALPPEPVHESV